ncbi:MAG TPA: response regulator [candidate division Zixibacteria bacterium]|nr:response regulator [candidate division Zixibacteria bacterium]
MSRKILFVDDEPGIRETLPHILALHGFQVTCTGTVAEALGEIASHKFDVLISDLNIGEPADGFTVVSAMKRTQPDCITLILTGYPAFDTALQALRSQVDDYLVKPAMTRDLVKAIEKKLTTGERVHPIIARKRIPEILRENIREIVQRAAAQVKVEPDFNYVHLSEEELAATFIPMLEALIETLTSKDSDSTRERSIEAARWLGGIRRSQGFSIAMVATCSRLLKNAIYAVIGDHMLVLDMSFIISDFKLLSYSLSEQLEESIRSFQLAGRRLVFDGSGKWKGWFCERCCWNRPLPHDELARTELSARIVADFDAHTCQHASS